MVDILTKLKQAEIPDMKIKLARMLTGLFHANWPVFEKHPLFTMKELVKPENQDKTREKSTCTCPKHDNETFLKRASCMFRNST